MSAETVTMYRILCDFPHCKVSAQDDSDYYAWMDEGVALDEALDSDWHQAGDDENAIFCDGHPARWASDFGGEEPGWDLGAKPETYPFLVLNDFGSGDGEAFIADNDATLCVLLDRLAA